MIRLKYLHLVYPYFDVSLRMRLYVLTTNLTSGRSFTILRRIKIYLRFVVSNDCLNALVILNIKSDLSVNIVMQLKNLQSYKPVK